ncbi:MAG: N-formylglutamate amidohydrolase, partial [Pseudomonadota bacterium]
MVKTPAYTLEMPEEHRSAALFNSPHSGRAYDGRFLARTDLPLEVLRSSEDAFVDELFDAK